MLLLCISTLKSNDPDNFIIPVYDLPLLWESQTQIIKKDQVSPIFIPKPKEDYITQKSVAIDKPLLWEPRNPTMEFDTMPPVPIWTMKCDGSTERARVTDMPEDNSVRSNLGLIFMDNVSFNYDFIYDKNEITPGVTPSAEWGLKVKNQRYDAKAVIIFSDYVGNADTITIDYFAPKVIIRPNFSTFGIVKKGSVVFSDYWLINLSNKMTVVKQLELKDKNKGFTISDINLPVNIPPLDSVKFTIKFTATEEGKFIDSIGIGDGCVFFNLAQVEAVVKQSIINVSDALFDDLPIKKTDSMTIEIRNDGNVDLIITGFKGPTNSAFKTNLPEISSINPLIIKPDNPPYKFTVEFHPLLEELYRDSIVFFSDADKIDSVAVLNGYGIQPGMISSSYDWGRKRIGNEYTAGNQCITIENTSDGDVTIYGFVTKVNKGGSVFQFDEKLLNNITIHSGEIKFIPVKFKPMDTGVYELVIIYDNSINSQTETRLFGIGVNPRLETQNVAFDTSVVEHYQNPIHDTVRFKNVEWEFADTIRINDLKILPNGDEISIDSSWGAAGFKFDKKSLNLPRILFPGEVLEIPMMFVAKKEGDVYTSIKTISDIEPEVTAYIHGFGRNQKINVETITNPPSTCLGGQDTIIYSVENLGNELIDIKNITIDTIDSNTYNHFRFEDPRFAFGFPLEPGRNEIVKILYKPDRPGKSLADLVVYNNTLYNSIIHNKLEGEGIQKRRNIRVNLLQDNNRVLIGKMFQCNIILEPGDDIDFIDIKQLSVEIRYNGGIIRPFPEDIKLGGLLEGRFQINNLKIIDNPGIIRLTLDTLDGIPGQKLSGDGELLKIIYHVYLPNSKDSSDKSIIDPYIYPVETGCIDFSDTKTVTVQIDPVCLNDIRKINVNSLNYGIGSINPNPVSSEGSEIVYSIGLEGNTQFEILNAEGERVYSLSYQNQKPGVYSFNIPSEILESGVYWFRIVSGPFSSIKEFIIIK